MGFILIRRYGRHLLLNSTKSKTIKTRLLKIYEEEMNKFNGKRPTPLIINEIQTKKVISKLNWQMHSKF